jgi:D-alanine-D-alanine ligase
MNFPIVIKPVNEGSSIGVRICENILELNKASKFLFKKYIELILEPYIGGQEIQVAILNNAPVGAIELEPKRKFYDYKAKYSKAAKTKHIMPANLKKPKYKEVLKIAKKAHHILGCKGITRSDFKFFKNQFYLLEINTQPGMTSLSLVPEIASYKRISFENLVEKILLNASINR